MSWEEISIQLIPVLVAFALAQGVAAVVCFLKMYGKLIALEATLDDIKTNHLAHLQTQIDRIWDYLHGRS